MGKTACETCANYVYDELEDCYFCSVNLDEDEIRAAIGATEMTTQLYAGKINKETSNKRMRRPMGRCIRLFFFSDCIGCI